MKLNYHTLFFFFLVAISGILLAIPAAAQYENDPAANELKELNQNPDLNLGEEKVLLFEHERSTKGRDSSYHSKPTAQSAPVSAKIKSPEAAKPSAAKEEDALSFNFLYYIIQKFKISDLVDE